MTRNFASISTAIWRADEDFTNLSSSAQRTYFLLKTQADISAAGVLPLTIGRWATKAKDTTPDSIRADIAELEAGRFVFCDDTTEELLVRTFVRWDNGYGNPKRRPVILDAARSVESLTLRRALATEFHRLGLPTAGLVPPQRPPDRPRGSHADSLSGGDVDTHASTDHHRQPDLSVWDSEESGIPSGNGVSPQVNRLSDSPANALSHGESPSDRYRGTGSSYVEPLTLIPPPPPAAPTVAHPEPVTPEEGEENSDQELIDEIRAVRPEWSARSIRRAIRHADVADRPPALVADAMRLVAADPTSQAPGRLRGDGPWWAAARARQPKPAAEINPSCGNCDQNRQVSMPDGRMTRCPDCHPLRRAS